eukprot:15419818-Alexandrium_andersonii.AAC.1
MAWMLVERSIVERTHKERGDLLVFCDPRAKAVGGRAPWREPLSDPRVVVRGARRDLRCADGSATGEFHMGKVVCIREADDGDS